jgi:hypothetical protein
LIEAVGRRYLSRERLNGFVRRNEHVTDFDALLRYRTEGTRSSKPATAQ